MRTDFAAEGRDRNRVAKGLPPNVLKAAERLGRAARRGRHDGGERGVWLCHTVCELGATRMEDSLKEVVRFLEDNPGEVVILFIEPYVRRRRNREASSSARGSIAASSTLQRDEPLPTLGALVRRDKRVVVLTEKDADGTVPGTSTASRSSRTRRSAPTQVDQLRCKLTRGDADSPLLMLNHWADLFPPRLRANVPFLPSAR